MKKAFFVLFICLYIVIPASWQSAVTDTLVTGILYALIALAIASPFLLIYYFYWLLFK